RVGHGQVVAVLHRNLALDLDLPAEVHEEGPVGHVDDTHAGDRADAVDDLLAMAVVAGLEGDVAGHRALADLDQVDGADVAAGFADPGRGLPQHAGRGLDLQPHGLAVARAGSVDHDSSNWQD